MTIEDVAKLDQATAEVIDTQPVLWWGLFTKCKLEGFTEQQAMELVKTYIISLFQAIKPQ